jgi:hypothetical protein
MQCRILTRVLFLTQVGGCQQQVAADDTILWAFDAFSKTHFLKLDGPSTAKVGVPVQGETPQELESHLVPLLILLFDSACNRWIV